MEKVRVSVLKPRISGKRVRGYETVAVNLTISEAILECHKHEATYGMAEKYPCKLKREKSGASQQPQTGIDDGNCEI